MSIAKTPLLLVPVSMMLLIACGSPKKSRDDLIAPDRDVADSVFREYELADENCQGQKEEVLFDTYKSHIWDGAQTSTQEFPGSEVYSRNSLSSNSTMTTWYGQYQQETCELVGGSLLCKGPSKVIQGSSPLRVCNSEADYDRESIEGIAITSLHNIDLANKFYLGIEGSKTEVGRTGLLVLPKIEQKYQVERDGKKIDRSYVISNNLAYVSVYRGAPSFVIYPTSEKVAPNGDASKPNLWESKWALAHEYGHHILRTHSGITSIKGSLDAIGNMESPLTHRHTKFDGEIPPKSAFSLAATRVVGPREHWKASNEAFADLFAFYSLGQEAGLMKNLPCMDTNRDITSGKFVGTREKVLDPLVLSKYYSPVVFNPPDCDEPYYQGPHSIGAIIAYGLNKVFQASASVGAKGSSHAAVLLLDWADQIQVLVGTGNENLKLPELVKLGVKVSASGDKLTAAQCDAVKEVFPVWAASWLAPATGASFTCN